MQKKLSTLPFKGTPKQKALLDEVIEQNKHDKSRLMAVVQEAQEIYGYLPIEVQSMIAEGMDVPLEKVYGVATFYAQFSLAPKGKYNISVCMGTACYVKGSQTLLDALTEKLGIGVDECTPDGKFSITACRCIGACGLGPVVIVYPEGTFYSQVKIEDVEEFVESHLLKEHIVERLVYADTGKVQPKNPKYVTLKETAFYRSQDRIVLRNCGVINPEDINEYIARDGYQALNKALTTMTPDDVIKCISDSGLRGRGGGGFPTGFKWALCVPNKAPQKYVVCNADVGDPDAFMDRSVLEGDPHCIIEAMTIAGFTKTQFCYLKNICF